MDLRDAVAITSASIRTHKLRSFLAASGVVLGIGSVIAVVTLGAGIQQAIVGAINDQFDPTTITIALRVQGAPAAGPQGGGASVLAFTDRDVDRLAALPGIRDAGATAPSPGAEVRLAEEVLGGLQVQAHRGPRQTGLLEGKASNGDAEATVSNLTAQRLARLLGHDALGAVLTLRHPDGRGGFTEDPVTVVGVEKESSPFTPPQESLVLGPRYAPTVPFQGQATRAWQTVVVQARDATDLASAKASAEKYLETSSDARFLKGDRLIFQFLTQEEAARLVANSVSQFTLFIGGIGAVSLLVGLVGIANIMLVSVQERTREIGVMKATGATRADVVLVFLVESVVICIVGAVLGVALGLVLGVGLTELLRSFNPSAPPLPFVAQPEWYAAAVVLGIAVGLVAGLYPAWRAAKVSPVEALRYE